ncbi:MAG: 16S rRNA (adenine(1518)-N(6)/adenine(1519)-N(6))-dimethyltransferase RsmA [Bryobacteraceae bacterium]
MAARLGQHFLVRDSILSRIADVACGNHAPQVIEIGPGRGALTRHLLERADQLHAIEIDRNLRENLERQFNGHPGFHLHQTDVLETDLSQWGLAVLVGNLPYYITSPIISRFLRLDLRFSRAVFLIQEEVAERLRAVPRSRDYGFLTVQTQLICDVEIVMRVPPGAFSPPPKVRSALVKLTKRRAMDEPLEQIVRFAGWCFAQKRKTLRNNLKGHYPLEAVDSLPEAGLRAEQLSLEQFIDLEQRLGASLLG